MNAVILIGNVGRAPKLLQTERLGQMWKFNLAVDLEGPALQLATTDDGTGFWVPIVVHANELLHWAAILTSGDRVRVVGKLQPVGTTGRMEVEVGPGGRLDLITE